MKRISPTASVSWRGGVVGYRFILLFRISSGGNVGSHAVAFSESPNVNKCSNYGMKSIPKLRVDA